MALDSIFGSRIQQQNAAREARGLTSVKDINAQGPTRESRDVNRAKNSSDTNDALELAGSKRGLPYDDQRVGPRPQSPSDIEQAKHQAFLKAKQNSAQYKPTGPYIKQ
jgi:hypothetical protein